jgi:hypothetical protein
MSASGALAKDSGVAHLAVSTLSQDKLPPFDADNDDGDDDDDDDDDDDGDDDVDDDDDEDVDDVVVDVDDANEEELVLESSQEWRYVLEQSQFKGLPANQKKYNHIFIAQ